VVRRATARGSGAVQAEPRAVAAGERRSRLGAQALDIRLSGLTRQIEVEPVHWIEESINLCRDPSSAAAGMVHLDAYQREPIEAQYDPRVREIVVMAVEQTGKSSIWRWPMAHRMLFRPGPAWVIYESDEKAEDINAESFEPVLRSVPGLESQLNRLSATRRRYSLRNGAVLDFSGAGADITSKPRRDGVADELDRWPMTLSGIRQNLRNFRKRFRTYWAMGEGCLVIVSSPRGEDSPVADEWQDTSRGTWHLRCAGCAGLTMPSHAVHLLQWEASEDGAVVADSLRLECPACGREHSESEASAMTASGGYVHDAPERWDRRGYQWGALAAVPRVFSWRDIARAQLQAGKSADVTTQADFDNSWRGLRFRPRRVQRESVDLIRQHCAPLPDPAILAQVLFAADTQDDGWYWVVRGVDQRRCTYLLGYGKAMKDDDLMAAWDASYLGIQPAMGLIDQGGHGERPKQVTALVAKHRGLYSYKGNPRIGQRWMISKTDQSLILANPGQFQADLLYYLYSQPRRDSAYLFLPPDPSQEYVDHMAALCPDNKLKHGDRYENWHSTAPDHWFDAERMWLVLMEYAMKHCRQWRLPMPGTQAQRVETRRPGVEVI